MTPYTIGRAILAVGAIGMAQTAGAQEVGGKAQVGAVEPAPPSEAKEKSGFDRLWDLTTLYKDDDDAVLNELRVTGRLHLDHYLIESDNGDDNDLVVRRARLGLKARMFEKLEAQVEGDFNLEGGPEPFFIRFTDAYLAWKFSDAAKLTVGKHGAKFTLDGATSSNDLLAIDRSNVANNFWFTDEYAPGVSVAGKSGPWSYYGGVYSGGRKNRGFGDLEGGVFWIGSVGHDLGKRIGVKKALVRLDYVRNKPDAESDSVRPFKNIGSLALIVDDTRWGFSGEITGGDGWPGQSDAFGITAMPWLSLTERLQLVGRYTFLDSEDANGLRLARYDNVVTSGRGDRYHELYGGLNYYIYGTKLKAQTGISYADMRDRAGDGGEHQGWTWTTALRISL